MAGLTKAERAKRAEAQAAADAAAKASTAAPIMTTDASGASVAQAEPTAKTTAATDSPAVKTAAAPADPLSAGNPAAAREVAQANGAATDPVTGAVLTSQPDPVNPNLTSGVQPADGTAGMEGRPDGDFIIQTDVHSAGEVHTFAPGEPALSPADRTNADNAFRIALVMGGGSREIDAVHVDPDRDLGSLSGKVDAGDRVRIHLDTAFEGETEFEATVVRVKPGTTRQLLVDLDVELGRLGTVPVGSVPEGDPDLDEDDGRSAGVFWFKA